MRQKIKNLGKNVGTDTKGKLDSILNAINKVENKMDAMIATTYQLDRMIGDVRETIQKFDSRKIGTHRAIEDIRKIVRLK
jgi:hypothetical protein